MAKLILTAQEKQSANYLQWDDESLGRAVKKLALGIVDHHHGDKAIAYTACATMLACLAADRDAETVIELTGVNDGGVQRGNWKITITRSAAKAEAKSKVVGRINGDKNRQ